MADLHQSLDIVKILATRRVQGDRLAVSGELQPAVMFLLYFGQRGQHRFQVPPLEIAQIGAERPRRKCFDEFRAYGYPCNPPSTSMMVVLLRIQRCSHARPPLRSPKSPRRGPRGWPNAWPSNSSGMFIDSNIRAALPPALLSGLAQPTDRG